MSSRPTVAIIGAGFSGLLTALHLLADPEGPQVRLVEKAGAFARGTAYSTGNARHILNVRVANMSAFPADPQHFQHWLDRRPGWQARAGFVTRGCYGDYLQDMLWQAAESPAAAGRLLLEADEVTDLRREGAGWRLTLAMGREFSADAVVLALGVTPPALPTGATEDLEACSRYIADPWGASSTLPEGDGPVLLLGSGLTMIDVALSLEEQGRRMVAISRRGLSPMPHAEGDVTPVTAEYAGSPAKVLRQAQRRRADGDWRQVIDGMRPHVAGLWRQWGPADRRRFLRHLRPWWEAGRHRMAPSVARGIDQMIARGQLTIHAGRTIAIDPGFEQVHVTWRAKGEKLTRRRAFDALINCTGPGADLQRSGSPLILSLLAQGVIRPDPCQVGIDVDSEGRVLDLTDLPLDHLRVVGALSRAARWEITSVPDIRVQAAATAYSLIAALREPAPAPAIDPAFRVSPVTARLH
ncbi:FAD/NAD(P)-binding protein [Phenylobacterium sp.]|uniref:FAD/NAD(P)-binding protein n=1 Tax=Phenylobacterium sp. TaxID=1871053 RepID=UPI00272FF96C|nr:FAD/NAD(P)-binding protein [Phenylobacterium sp.]MDP1618118.1 FAD/NAD(P)-binding protein [Phenylobacterium sp.]MDP1986529.1 FAD/NAD(P)-binding protein [Phenylobacterium sp.]